MKPERVLDYIDGLFMNTYEFSDTATKDMTKTQIIQ